MAYRDFQHFLEVLESKGELRRVKEPLSPTLEITEVADRVMKAGGPALLFENVVGQAHRLGTSNPMSAVMGHASIGFQPMGSASFPATNSPESGPLGQDAQRKHRLEADAT
ncbi:MAG: UbiD family decarboxylase, partial [Chlorobia bacterium]|nr:UbiD family decarboxylase [Fimbriimonadaceae bacterium]